MSWNLGFESILHSYQLTNRFISCCREEPWFTGPCRAASSWVPLLWQSRLPKLRLALYEWTHPSWTRTKMECRTYCLSAWDREGRNIVIHGLTMKVMLYSSRLESQRFHHCIDIVGELTLTNIWIELDSLVGNNLTLALVIFFFWRKLPHVAFGRFLCGSLMLLSWMGIATLFGWFWIDTGGWL